MTTPKTPDLAAVARCDYTKNPCGSDTHRVGNPCNCLPCRGFAYGYDRAQADLAALRDGCVMLEQEMNGYRATIDAQNEELAALRAERDRLKGEKLKQLSDFAISAKAREDEIAALRERLAVAEKALRPLIDNDGCSPVREVFCVFCQANRIADDEPHRDGCPARTPGGTHETE